MDPNKTLENIRKAMDAIGEDGDNYAEAVEDLVAYFYDLDTWLRKGGFLPDDWAKGRLPTTPS